MRYTISLAFALLLSFGAGAQTTPPQSGVPLPDQAAIESMGEVSCHVQEEQQKNADGTTVQAWRPWLRVARPDGSVWAQKRKTFSVQSVAVQECQAWVEIATHLRLLHQIKKEHSERLIVLESQHKTNSDRLSGLESQRLDHEKRLIDTETFQRKHEHDVAALDARIEALEKQVVALTAAIAETKQPKKR